MRLLIIGLAILLTGLVGFTLPVPSTGTTMIHLLQLCKNGGEHQDLQKIGLDCTNASNITYLIYSVAIIGGILTVMGVFLNRKKNHIQKH